MESTGKQAFNVDKLYKTQGFFSSDLVTLDFRSDSLQKFLEHVVSIVNQQSLKINKLQSEKLDKFQALSGNQAITNAIAVNHPSLVKSIVIKKQLPASQNDTYSEVTQRLTNKLDHYNQSIEFLCRGFDEKDKRLSQIQKKNQDYVSQDNLKQKLKLNQSDFKKSIEDESTKLQGRMKQLQNKVNKKLGDFENLTKVLQKNTLWKITQCQQGLAKRITSEYVEKAMQQLQAKIIRQVNNNLNSEANDLKFKFQDLTQTQERDQKRQQDINENIHKTMNELHQLSRYFPNQNQTNQRMNELDSKLQQSILKIQKLQKRIDPRDLQLRLTKDISEVYEKSNDANKRSKNLEEQLQGINAIVSSFGSAEGSNDPHRLCFLDGEIKRVKDSSRSNQSKINVLEQQLKTKLLVFEQRISTSIAMMRSQQNNVSRQQLYQSLNRLREPMNQRYADHQNLINQIIAKIQKLQSTEKAIKKKIKEMTKGEDFNKILDQKLNIQEAKLSSDAMNQKIDALMVTLEKMKMEIQFNSSFVKDMKQKMGDVEEGFSVFTHKQKVFPAKCLTCGIKHLPQNQRNQMPGTDGRFYRVDLKNNCVFDHDEVFDIVPSQITMKQTSKTNQSRIQSAKNRTQHQGISQLSTNSAFYGGGFRPQSAKKS